MSEHIGAVQWRDESVSNRYPFADGATLTADDGVVLPQSTFVDAVVHPPERTGVLYVTSVVRGDYDATLWVGDEATPKLCSTTWRLSAPPAVTKLADAYGRPCGLFVCDGASLAVVQGWPIGEHAFGREATELAASCCIVPPAPVLRGFLLDDGSLWTGEVVIVGEAGVVVSKSDDGEIRFDAAGDPLSVRRRCGPDGAFATPRFVKTINSTPPGPDGAWRLEASSIRADTALRIVQTADDAITISVVGKTTGGRS